MRVAVVTETYPPELNGVAMTLGRMVGGLRRRGHPVQLVRPRQAADPRRIAQAGIEELLVHGVRIPRYGDLQFGITRPGTLAAAWRRWQPDIVHVVTEGPLGWSAVAAARRLGLPLTSGFHTNFHAYSHHYGIGWARRPIEGYLRRLHNRTLATFVPTRALAGQLEGAGYRNLKVLSRGVDTELFTPARRSAVLRARWGAGADNPVLLYVGRLAAEKNISMVLAAFGAVRKHVANARMVFVGDGPLRASLAASCGDGIFAGVRSGDDLAAHYASADIFLFPSLTETFGNVTTEALASGLGVVAYEHAGAADLIRDGVNGRLAPPGDERGFIDAALALAMDSAQLSRVRAGAAPSVAALDWERVHDRYCSLLAEAIAARQACIGVRAAA